MSVRERLAGWIRPVLFLGHNPATATGAVLTTSSGLTLVSFWALEILSGRPTHPYAGLLLFLILPGIFVLGLALIPVGLLRRRHLLRARGELPSIYPQIDLREPVLRNAAALVMAATVLNVSMMGYATYRGVEHMDSVQFCGLTCHSVMAPEYTAYAGSPHSRVACVECHIGPGADWFVRSKLSGVRQVFAVALGTYSKPIPSPVHELRPARETCEQCHWPQKFHGDKLLVRTKFADDEANTKLVTVLMLRIGGRSTEGAQGIHGRHLDENSRIQYVSIDGRRQVIPRVTYLDDAGQTVEYVSQEIQATPEQLASGERRSMDCVDCHNRPTHAFQLPERAVDQALEEGRISPELPFIRKKAVEALRAEYPDREAAGRKIGEALLGFYRTEYPHVYQDKRAVLEGAVEQVRDIYLRNVFPGMRLTWGTHPNNIGHEDFLGCFRCHDDQHKSADGRVIPQDCESCHAMLAMEESDPQILSELGLK